MVERICPTCHQKVDVQPGLHNAKNLFRKPTLQDWITLAILVLVLVGAYSYNIETKACREMLKNPPEFTTVPTGIAEFNLSHDIEIPAQEEKLQG